MIPAVSLGQMGAVLASNEGLPEGHYVGFLCLTAVEVGAFKGSLNFVDGSAALDLTGITFPAGIYVPVPFTHLAVTTGNIIAIKAGGI
jgi:hypothetical protein